MEVEGISQELTELIEVIARSLADNPDEVHVSTMVGEQTTVLELKVNKSDLGKMIGKKGRNAQAIRTLLIAAASKLKIRAVLEILE